MPKSPTSRLARVGTPASPKANAGKSKKAKTTTKKAEPEAQPVQNQPVQNQDNNKTLKIVCCSLGGCCGCIVLIIFVLWLFSFFGVIAPGFWPAMM